MQTHIVPGGRREGIADKGAHNKEKQIGLEGAVRSFGARGWRGGGQATAGLGCCPSQARKSHGRIELEDNCGLIARANQDKTGAGCRPWGCLQECRREVVS